MENKNPYSTKNLTIRYIKESYRNDFLNNEQVNELLQFAQEFFAENEENECFIEFMNQHNYVCDESEKNYFHVDEAIEVDGEYYHDSEVGNSIVFDEINEEYILERNSVCVYHYDGRRNVEKVTHEDELCNYSYFSQIGYISDEYMYYNDIVRVYENDELYYANDVYYWESDGEYHLREENEDEIKSYSYKPNTQFFKTELENNQPFYGIELEVENELNNMNNGKMAKTIASKELYFKCDGSLNNGFEIVSHPLTFDYIQNKKDMFSSMLDNLKNNGFRSYNSSTCGMHIHISKDSFSTWHLFRFMQFFNSNKEFITKISQRELNKLERWATLENDSVRDIRKKIVNAKKNKGYNYSRYSAINIQNEKTIEIRIFRGTLFQGSFFKNIEFIDSLFNYTKDIPEVNLNDYKKFVNGKKEYKNLAKFIQLKGL